MTRYLRTVNRRTMTVHAPHAGELDRAALEEVAAVEPVLGLDVETSPLMTTGRGFSRPGSRCAWCSSGPSVRRGYWTWPTPASGTPPRRC